MKLLVILSVSLALTGCLGKMERITEDTRASVERSNHLIKETHMGQTFGTAYLTVNNKDLNDDVREFSVEPLVILANEQRLGGYLGAPDAALNDPEAIVIAAGKTAKVPNVSYLYEEPTATATPAPTPTPAPAVVPVPIGITPRNLKLHKIYHAGLRRAAWRYFLLSQRAPTLSSEKKEEYRSDVARITEAVTIVFGAGRVEHVIPTINGARARHFEHAEAERRLVAGWLKQAAKNFSANSETEQQLHRVVESRLGFSIR